MNGARTEVERSSNGERYGKYAELHLFVAKFSFELLPQNLSEKPLMMSMGMIFFMIVVFFRLENGSKKRSVFLRYDIGMISELSSAKMERVLANFRVQSYNTKKRIPNFFANLWRFEKLKTAHSPSVYWSKIIFLYRNGVQISKSHLKQKMTPRQN